MLLSLLDRWIHKRIPTAARNRRLLLASSILAVASSSAPAGSDWPQFLGPTRNGAYPGNDLAATWPKEGPRTVWSMKIGQGFSGPVATEGKVILFQRIDDRETVECLDALTGKPIWKQDYPTAYHDDFGFDEGPRATPSIADGRVYTYGAEGRLTCLDFNSGTNVWAVDAKARFGGPKGFFGIACSPLVEGSAVLLNVGGPDGSGIVAFDRKAGTVLWKATDDEASYSSPVIATVDGRQDAFILTRSRLVAVEPSSGKIDFQYPFRPTLSASVTAATPLVIGNDIFLSACYGAGAVLLEKNGRNLQKLWTSDDMLSNHYATSVYHNGFLYGLHGRTDPGMEPAQLRCVELKTGKVRWENKSLGAATIILATDQLLILTEKGELIKAPASPDGFKPANRAQVLGTQVRAHPALAGGLFYARSRDKLVCLDLRESKPQ